MTMTSFALIRHGPTDWNGDRRIQGSTDIPLGDSGRKTVAGWRLPPELDAYDWVCSPMVRALETARILGAPQDIRTDDRLREMDWGDWEGQRLADLRKQLGGEMADNEARGMDFRPPGGESPRDLLARLTPWMTEVSAHPRPTLAVVHNGVVRALYALATGWSMTGKRPIKFDWGTVHFFRVDASGKPVVDRMNVRLVGRDSE